MKAHKLRVFPTPSQKATLVQWIGAARFTYNACLSAIKSGQIGRSKAALRQYALNADSPLLREHPWLAETPYDLRDEAMADLLEAYRTNFAAGRAHFDIKFRSRKDKSQSLRIRAKHWNRRSGQYASILNVWMLRAERVLPQTIPCDARLIRTRLGRYNVCLPQPLVPRTESQGPPDPERHCTIALDPGVRTFVTGYDPDGRVVEWGRGDIGRICRMCSYYDRLQGKIMVPTTRKRSRYRMRRAGRRIQERIRNLVDEMHRKLALWLCRSYRVILLPKFETQQMVPRAGRRIRSKTARSMLTWSHFRFRQCLVNKAREFPHCRVILCTEEYTSKTCGACGHLHQRLGGNKIFRCPVCHLVVDRDVNGARNILIKHLSQSGVPGWH